ncbi:hypothetical protein [Nonomuraea gerenzanensis]|uniref:Uncharacterized protein n=1 Tax=Nonomuraea gerenzanensis TaxID=93944 RepID=A0A1M4EE81_9ACTN|nr:hypothetical protein [Nonomuraea gerenzanensis]SBO97291.1 hypothetical protein BN4615_P6807 [Nonomuraea gerenzanensis]
MITSLRNEDDLLRRQAVHWVSNPVAVGGPPAGVGEAQKFRLGR